MGALTALRDAKDPKVGLVTARDGGKNYVGFLSYKSGRNQIEVVNMGTDGTKKGSGKALIQQVIRIAARENKSISIASVPSAVGFYKKMGFTSDGYSDFTMTAKEARRLAGL
jgi:predicted GNAT family acetyltransferase